MGVPSPRTPVRVARGTYSVLNTNKAALEEGEVCYATDENSLYVKEGNDLIAQQSATGGTFTGTHTYDSSGNVVINGSLDYNGAGNATFTNVAVESDLWCTNNSGIALYETSGNGSNKITIKSPAAVTADVTLTLPDGDGATDEFLQTNGSGVLSWGTSSSGATGGGTDAIFVENSQTITTNYSITTNKNAHSVGPLSINNNIVVTIPANSTWLVS
mgnify:CR=1 FL=1|tara:strand:- start:4382 stop:5029 length:648 start_codon:yes stop_codon:yes gene_type:complete